MQTKKEKLIEYGIITFLMILGLFVFLYAVGTLRSGYHLQDDHEFYSIGDKIAQDGFWDTIVSQIQGDLSIRFRPLYRLLRVVGVFFFGANTKLWSLCKMLEIGLALSFFYIFARERKIGKLFAVVFGLIILVGEQSAIWWRLGPQESLGSLLFAITLVATVYLSRKTSVIRRTLFVSFLILLSLQKESFTVTIPAFFILLLAYEIENGQINNSQSIKHIIIDFFKKHWIEIAVVILVLATEAYIIIFHVGTNSIGYAGISNEISVLEYGVKIFNILISNGLKYILLAISILCIAQIGIDRNMFKIEIFFELIFCAYIFTVQLILHAMGGMWERYLIPWVVCIAYFVVILCYRAVCNNKRILIPYGWILTIFVLDMSNDIVGRANLFREKGTDLRNCTYFILDHSDNTDHILATTIWPEDNGSFLIWMSAEHGYESGSGLTEKNIDRVAEMREADILWGYNGEVYTMMQEEAGLDMEDYDLYMTPTFEVAVKR